jgi:acetyltransferase-like isoleucine patch superfamily enzyme
MSTDRFHAFAEGSTYQVSSETNSRNWSRLMQWFRSRIMTFFPDGEFQKVADSFRSRSLFGKDLKVGRHAWCHNTGPRDRMQIGDEVVCRGLLRCEDWGTPNLVVSNHVYIGDDCIVSCADRIDIGDWTLLAHGSHVFDNDSHPTDPVLRQEDYATVLGLRTGPRPQIMTAPVVISKRVWIGMNALIGKGVCIGEGSIVASGSVVTKNVPPKAVVAGNPARVVKLIDD